MMVWNNFAEVEKLAVTPRLEYVLRIPAGCDAASFVRGVEAVVGVSVALAIESVEHHQAGPQTIELLKKKAAPGVTFEKRGDAWYMKSGEEEFLVALIRILFKRPHRSTILRV